MAHVYQHLTDATKFPDVTQAEPYAQYRNVFDYTRWTPGTKITVCNVPWDDARNIVGWTDETQRNTWFDNVPGHRETLRSEFHVLPEGVIKLPLPFGQMSRYNYVWVEYPTPTAPTDPLEHATGPAILKWGFFMDSPTMLAANTTECHLRLDAWTTFGSHVHFSYCQLKRGHAPLAATNVDDYLENPITHAGMLLTPDVTYGPDAAISKSHVFVPWTEGDKLVMFATTVSPTQFAQAGTTVDWDTDSTPPTYADNPARWGHQYDVTGYKWNMGDSDMRNLTTPTTPYTDNGVAPTLFCYAIDASKAKTLFETIVAKMPQIMQTIRGMWIVPANMASMGTAVNIAGIIVHECNSVNDMPDITFALTRDQFEYPGDYSNLAKLYTFPYAALELSDNDGKTAVIRIENTGRITLHRRVSLAYPYLKAQAFLTGVNGMGAQTYEWKRLDGTTATGTSYDTDFVDFMCTYDIPTYGLFVSGETDWSLHNQLTNIDAERLKALNAYHKAMRGINTTYENTKDMTNVTNANTHRSNETAYDNAVRSADNAQTTGNASAQTAYDNAIRSNETGRNNAHESNTVSQTNTNDSADTGLTIALATNSTDYTNAISTAQVSRTNANASAQTAQTITNENNRVMLENVKNSITTSVDNQKLQVRAAQDTTTNNNLTNIEKFQQTQTKIRQDYTVDLRLSATLVDLEKEANSITQGANWQQAIAGIVTQGLGGALTPTAGKHAASAVLGPAGFVAATGIGAVGSLVNTAIENHTSALMLNNKIDMINAQNIANRDHTQNTLDINDFSINKDQALSELLTRQNITLGNNINDNQNTLTQTNSQNTADLSNANAQREYELAVGNAQRSYATDTANAQRSKNTADSNAQSSRDLAHRNSERSFDTAEGNAQRTLETGNTNAQKNNELAHSNNQLNRDVNVTNSGAARDTGNANADATKNVTLNNALETREASEFSHKTDLQQAQDVVKLQYAQARNNAPVMHANYAGDPTPDLFAYRGVQIRIKTQSESAIRQTGDQFLRYGYAYEGNWDVTTLNVMPKFSYWEMEEVWLDSDTDIMEEAKNSIRGMFTNGVTVWTSPNIIGKVGIHDNR